MICQDEKLRIFLHADFCYYDELLGTTKQLFNPYLEDTELLYAWLKYRYIYPQTLWDHQYLAELSAEDMRTHGNNPALMDFSDFDPYKVTRNFLVAWLSWHGVTSTEDKPQKWWADLASKILEKRRQTKMPRTTLKKFEKLMGLESQSQIHTARFECIGDALAVVPRRVFLKAMEPEVRKENTRQILRKQILAKLLGASAIAVPLMYNVYMASDRFVTPAEFQERLLSQETKKMLGNLAAPLVLMYGANKLDKDTITPEMRGALMDDIAKNRPIPEATLKQLVGKSSTWAQLFSIVFLPVFVKSILRSD
uniref:Uncharacterized protein n=1 Tax=viral metagenome TaxID=1070528 RepID=A0A6C0BNH3_9ZZZZ